MWETDDFEYRVALAKGFLAEAEQDFDLQRWRSCVDNAQLSVENAGKAILILFGAAPKTHDPAKPVANMLRKQDLPPEVEEVLRRLLPDLLALGSTEHFLTDYGDEATHTLPWDLFTRESAADALGAARRLDALIVEVVETIRGSRGPQAGDDSAPGS